MSVVEDVISNVREAFLDEGVDEQVLQELKQVFTALNLFPYLNNLYRAISPCATMFSI